MVTQTRPSRMDRSRDINLLAVSYLGNDQFSVPSATRNGSYLVDVARRTCECVDAQRHPDRPCKHRLTVSVCRECGGQCVAHLAYIGGQGYRPVLSCVASDCGWGSRLRDDWS